MWLQETIDILNIKLSLNDLFGDRAKHLMSRRVDLDGLNGVKAAALTFVIFGHAMVLYLLGSADSLRALNFMENDPATMLVASGFIVIDSFFVITGLLMAFVGLRRLRRSKSDTGFLSFVKKSLQLGLARYLRLMPLFFLALLFKKTILLNMGTSVFWDYGYDNQTLAGACRHQNWFNTLTPMGAYVPITELCLAQSWSIFNDLFHCIALAPVIVLMARRPKLGSTVAMLIAVLSISSMSKAFNQMDPSVRADFERLKLYAFIKFLMESSHIYTAPHNRIFATAIGTVAGCCLYHYNTGKLEWPRWFRGAASGLSLMLVVAQLILPLLVPVMRQSYLLGDGGEFAINPLIMTFAMTGARFIWCLANAIIFMRITTDWRADGATQSGQLWRTLSRLNYPMLLIHLDLVVIDVQVQTTVRYYSWYGVWGLFGVVYLSSLLLAIPVHVLIENPLDKLLKLMVRKITPSSRRQGGTIRCHEPKQQDVVQPLGRATSLCEVQE